MGSISIDPDELDSTGAALQDVASSFDGPDGRLSVVSMSAPNATAGEVREFENRWRGWVVELQTIIDQFGHGLVDAATNYRHRESEIAGWAEL